MTGSRIWGWGALEWGHFLWFACVATVGSWAVLVPSKFGEGRVEDHTTMRFTLLVCGLLVGCFAWALTELLWISIPHSPEIGTPQGIVSEPLLSPVSAGTLTASDGANWREADFAVTRNRLRPAVFLAYFGFLFVLIRWWRQADYTRTHRVSLWSVAWCGFAAFLLHYFWWFPQPTGFLLFVLIAFTTQMSSAWLPTSRRRLMPKAALE